MSQTIRLAETRDLGSVENIARRAYQMYVSRIGREPAPMTADFAAHQTRDELWVLDADRGVSGFIVLYPRGDHIHVENVAVDPEQHGRGLGRYLLNFAEILAQKNDLDAIELYTNEKMTENLHLYLRGGYLETARREEDGFSRVYFRKSLDRV